MVRHITRRQFLGGASALTLGFSAGLFPGLSLAFAPTDCRLIVVIQRGAMDGLGTVIPYGDPAYAALRGDMAFSAETLQKADSLFGFHPVLTNLYAMYKGGEACVVHATASPYRDRSHFDAQNVLELGSTKPHTLDNGWLNRLVGVVEQANPQRQKTALAVGLGVPLVLRGPVEVSSWAPSNLPEVGDDFMSLVQNVEQHDPLFSKALATALSFQKETSDALAGDAKNPQMMQQSRSPQAFVAMARAAGQFLAAPQGPRIATLEIGGWDTHVQQGTEGGRLANALTILDRGIGALKESLGPAWSNTVVVTLTEFGRTAHPNGNKGTDHGTASCTFLAGGLVNGGRIYGDWPGLQGNQLYQNRDLRPTTDLRGVMKGVLQGLYGVNASVLAGNIYPDSSDVSPFPGLIRTS